MPFVLENTAPAGKGFVFDDAPSANRFVFDNEPEKKRSMIESAGRVATATAGSLALAPVAGAMAATELLPTVTGVPSFSSYDEYGGGPDIFPEVKPGSLTKAGQTLEDVGGIPGKLVTTPEEQKAVETIGYLMKPFEMAGEGWKLIGRLVNEKVKEQTGKEIPYLEPILGTVGESSAVFGVGGLGVKKIGGKLERGLSAKNIEKLNVAREAKYGKYGVVPEKAVAAGPKAVPLGIESQYLKKEFEGRFVFDEAVEQGSNTAKAVNKDLPGNDVRYDGIQEGIREGEQLYQFTAMEGPAKGATFYSETLKPEDVKSGIQRMIDMRKDEPKGRIGEDVKFEKTGEVKPEEGPTLYSGLPLPAIAKSIEKVGTKVWDKAIVEGIPKILDKVPGGKSVNRALIYDYRGDLPETSRYIGTLEKSRRNRQLGRSYGIDLGKRLQAVSQKDQLALGEFIRGEIQDLPEHLKGLGTEAKDVMLSLGKQAVDTGLLSEETFFKNAGKYMPRLYTSKEYQSLLTKFNIKKPERLDLSRFKQRKDIPKEIRQQMGEILTPGYPVAKGIVQLTHDIETAKWFKGISQNPEWALPKNSTSIPEGWKKLPSEKKLGALADNYVHPEIFQDIQQTIKVLSTPDKIWRKALGSWKFGKVVLSPKTHVRNLMSNSILAHLGGMPMYEQPVYLARAAKAMRVKGEYWKQAMDEGLLGTTWTEHELSSLFSEVDRNIQGIKAESIPEKLGRVGASWEKAKGLANKAAKTYQAEEEWFKLAKFIHNVERKKMTPQAAALDAEKWLFNYSKITKFQEAYKTSPVGAPFATFTFKALPRIAEAAVKTPHRFLLPMGMIYGLEKAAMNYIGDTPEQFKAKKEFRPDYMKGAPLGIPNFARVPIKDESGREYYLNLTYILPWGDIGESGSFAGIPGSLMPLSQPLTKELYQQISNRDTFFDAPIVPEKELAGKSKAGKLVTAAKLRAGHAARTFLPTPVLDVEKGIQALKGKPDYRGRLRPAGVVAADAILGIKMYPVDYSEQMVRIISEKDPQKGSVAKEILGQIKVFAIKKRAMEKAGKQAKEYDELIQDKVKQLLGLGKEIKELGAIFKKIKKD